MLHACRLAVIAVVLSALVGTEVAGQGVCIALDGTHYESGLPTGGGEVWFQGADRRVLQAYRERLLIFRAEVVLQAYDFPRGTRWAELARRYQCYSDQQIQSVRQLGYDPFFDWRQPALLKKVDDDLREVELRLGLRSQRPAERASACVVALQMRDDAMFGATTPRLLGVLQVQRELLKQLESSRLEFERMAVGASDAILVPYAFAAWYGDLAQIRVKVAKVAKIAGDGKGGLLRELFELLVESSDRQTAQDVLAYRDVASRLRVVANSLLEALPGLQMAKTIGDAQKARPLIAERLREIEALSQRTNATVARLETALADRDRRRAVADEVLRSEACR
jgi:hypothetical protein